MNDYLCMLEAATLAETPQEVDKLLRSLIHHVASKIRHLIISSSLGPPFRLGYVVEIEHAIFTSTMELYEKPYAPAQDEPLRLGRLSAFALDCAVRRPEHAPLFRSLHRLIYVLQQLHWGGSTREDINEIFTDEIQDTLLTYIPSRTEETT